VVVLWYLFIQRTTTLFVNIYYKDHFISYMIHFDKMIFYDTVFRLRNVIMLLHIVRI